MEQTPKKQIGLADDPNYVYKLTPQEFKLLTAPLKMFEYANAISNNLYAKAQEEGGVKPVFEEDEKYISKDENGQLVISPEFFQKDKKVVIATSN